MPVAAFTLVLALAAQAPPPAPAAVPAPTVMPATAVAPAAAASPSAPEPAEPPEEKMICRHTPPAGTMVGSYKECHTARVWARMARAE